MTQLANLCDRIRLNDVNLAVIEINEVQFHAELCEALMCNTVVHTLIIDDCKITDGSSFAAFLRSNCFLTSLNLYNNALGPDGIAPIANALQTNNSLTKLDLHNTDLEPDCIACIANALQANDSLTQLDLENTKLGDDGAYLLASVFAQNQSITEIDLSANDIHDWGMIHLAFAIRVNCSLKAVTMGGNNFSDVGLQCFADVLKVNRTLTYVEIIACRGGNVGARALEDALKQNRVLIDFDFDACRCQNCHKYSSCPNCRNSHQRCDDYLKRNRNETKLRTSCCQDVLVALLGIRKLHRYDSGMWQDQPRDVLRIIAKYIWNRRDRKDWQNLPNQSETKKLKT